MTYVVVVILSQQDTNFHKETFVKDINCVFSFPLCRVMIRRIMTTTDRISLVLMDQLKACTSVHALHYWDRELTTTVSGIICIHTFAFWQRCRPHPHLLLIK